MKLQSLTELAILQKLLKTDDEKYKGAIDEFLEDPILLSSIFSLASNLKLGYSYGQLCRLNLNAPSEKEFLRYYLIGLSIAILELKTHNCCDIQNKFMKLFEHVLINSARNNNFSFINSVLNS